MKLVLTTMSVIILVAVLAVGAFYLGQKSTGESSITPIPTVAQINQQATSAPTLAISLTKAPNQIISAGGVLVFPAYTLGIPSDWTSQREQAQDSDKLTLTKGAYKITIYEAAFGGGGCTYPGDAPNPMAQIFSSFVEINNVNGFVFRRGPTGSAGSWTVCQKNTTDGSFGAPTQFGGISITTPAAADIAVMAEVDGIITSIKKK